MASNILFDNKTPKTILMEVCAKKGLSSPKLEPVEIQKDPTVFQVVCQIVCAEKTITDEGYGCSKKAAEQAVALKVLPHILTCKELLNMTTAWKQIESEENRVQKTIVRRDKEVDTMDDPVSDTDDNEITGDRIGQLNTVCARNKLPLPEYKDSQVGPQNKAIFTFKVSVGSICSTQGRRYVKKDAKKIAAFRALKELEAKGFTVSDKKIKGKSSLASACQPSEVTSSHDDEGENPAKTILDVCNITVENNLMDEIVPSTLSDQVTTTGVAKGKRNQVLPSSSKEEQNAAVPQQMEIDDQDEFARQLKRKLAAEEEDRNCVSSSPVVKRKYELLLGQMLTCLNQSENCLRFVKDYSHVFQHLPPNSVLDEALSPKNFELFLEQHGGPLELLKKIARVYNAKLTFPSQSTILTDKDKSNLVLLRIKFESLKNLQLAVQNVHVFAGTGKDFTTATEQAALNALKFLREVLFTDSNNNFSPTLISK